MARSLLCALGIVGLIALTIAQNSFNADKGEEKVLSRKKRYLVFPDGASLLARFSIATNLIGVKDPSNWLHIIELDAIYKLPNSSQEFTYSKKKKTKKFHNENYHPWNEHPQDVYLSNMYKPETFYHDKSYAYQTHPEQYFYKHRRNRRDVYEELKSIFEMQGLDGNSCLMRAICEVKHILANAENLSIFEEIFLKIFTVPPGDDDAFESDFEGSLKTSDARKCSEWVQECPVSLLDFVFSNVHS